MDEELEKLIAEANEERDNPESQNEEQENLDNNDELDGKPEGDEPNDELESKQESKNEEPEEVNSNEEEEEDKGNEPETKTDDSFEPLEIEVNGHKVKIENKDELMAFVKRGASSFGKEEKQPKEEELYIEQGKLTKDDLQLLIDAKNGNATAIAKLATMANVDLLDVDNSQSEQYKPQFQPDKMSEVDIVANSILQNQELATKFRNVSSSLPESFVNAISSNANDLSTFAEHVQSGFAEEVIPRAIKMSYSGVDFATAYVQSATALMQERSQQGSNNATENRQRNVSDREAKLRQQASERNTQQPKGKNLKGDMSEEDVWNLSDEEFEALTKSKS